MPPGALGLSLVHGKREGRLGQILWETAWRSLLRRDFQSVVPGQAASAPPGTCVKCKSLSPTLDLNQSPSMYCPRIWGLTPPPPPPVILIHVGSWEPLCVLKLNIGHPVTQNLHMTETCTQSPKSIPRMFTAAQPLITQNWKLAGCHHRQNRYINHDAVT